MRSVAVSVAAFAIAFFATALLRRTAPAGLPAPAFVQTALVPREVVRPAKPPAEATPERAPFSKTWDAAIRQEYDLRVRAMVVKKTRRARRDLDLTEAQRAMYELRLREAAERDPTLPLGDWDRSDLETLVPLLDSRQHVRYLEHLQKGAEDGTQSETQALARALSVDGPTAARVLGLLNEEGVVPYDAFVRLFDKPGEAKRLLDQVAAAMVRVRVRARSLLSPAAGERLDRRFADEIGTLEILVEEIQRAGTLRPD